MVWSGFLLQVAPVTGSPPTQGDRHMGTWCLPCFKDVLESEEWTRHETTHLGPHGTHMHLVLPLVAAVKKFPSKSKGRLFFFS